MPAHRLKSTSTPVVSKVPVGPLPVLKCTGARWTPLVTDRPPPSKEYRKPEIYYEGVLKGARLIAGECSKDVIFE